MMKPIGRVAGLFVTLCAAILASGGCAVDGGQPEQDEAGGSPADFYSPARERVRPGFAEMVLTDQVWPSFEQASANRISLISDGLPIYAHIRTARPIGDLSVPANPGGRYRFSSHPHLYLHVGDNESLRSLSTCYVTLAPADVRSRELVVPLSPLAFGPGENPTDCWLTVAASAEDGRHTYEFRLAGLTGPYNSWLPVADLLAVTTLPADFTGGSRRYSAQLQAAADAQPAASPEVKPVSGATLWSLKASPAGPAPVEASTAPVPKASPQQSPVRVVIHHLTGDTAADARARDLQAALASQRELNVEIRSTPLVVTSDNLRIFFAADRDEALRTRNLVALGAAPIREFSDYRPLPSPGTIEIWLAATQAALPTPMPQPRSAAPEMQATAAAPPATSRRKDAPVVQQPAGSAGSGVEELRLLLLQPSPSRTGARK